MIAVSKRLGENIKNHFHIDCAVVNNMFGQEFLNPQIITSTSLQKQKIVFVSVARIDYKKGFDVLINALKKAIPLFKKKGWVMCIFDAFRPQKAAQASPFAMKELAKNKDASAVNPFVI